MGFLGALGFGGVEGSVLRVLGVTVPTFRLPSEFRVLGFRVRALGFRVLGFRAFWVWEFWGLGLIGFKLPQTLHPWPQASKADEELAAKKAWGPRLAIRFRKLRFL